MNKATSPQTARDYWESINYGSTPQVARSLTQKRLKHGVIVVKLLSLSQENYCGLSMRCLRIT